MKQATSYLISKTTLALVFILGSFTGCKKDTPSQVAIDRSIYFIIRIDDQAYTSYGYQALTTFSHQRGGPSILRAEGIATLTSTFAAEITVMNEVQDNYFTSSSTGKIISLGNVSAYILMSTSGNQYLGTYNRLEQSPDPHKINQVVINRKSYSIDPYSFSCTLTFHGGEYNQPYIATIGNFTCKLFEKSNPALLIPASGQFKMYSN